MSSITDTIDAAAQVRAERLAAEKRAKRMAQDSASHRVSCPTCSERRTYTFRKSGELLFCCYGCGCAFDDTGAVR